MSSLSIRVDNEIELRLLELRYADAMFALTVRNIEHLRPWMPWAVPEPKLEMTQAYIKSSLHQFAEGIGLPTGLWYQDELVGSIGFPRMSWEGHWAEIGYWLDKDMQGKGLITRSTTALINYAFDEYGLNKVEIQAAARNTRSRAVPERLGFILEGTRRQVEWLQGEPHDLVIYGMLKSEWLDQSAVRMGK